MRSLDLTLNRHRYLFPLAVLRPGNPTDLTIFSAIGLLDTGATVSGIGPRAIESLGLTSYGKSRLRSATDEAFVSYFVFRLGFYTSAQRDAAGHGAEELPFVFDDLDGFSWMRDADFDVIVGMDVLSRCDMTFSRNGRGSISFGN
jgi:hypothetical protein